MLLSYEEAAAALWRDERYRQLMLDSYLDPNPAEAARRYGQSEEFSEVERILSRKGSGGLVLDLGAGNGILSFALAGRGYRVLALEPGDGSITGRRAIYAVQDATGARLEGILDGRGEKIPVENGCLDAVVARQVLHHAGNLPAMCAEIHRVLKPRGLFLAIREHVIFKKKDLERFLSEHVMHRLTGEENAYTLPYYKKCIQEAGFSKIKTYAFWDSALNYAPLRKAQVNALFAEKLNKRFPFLPLGFLERALDVPGVSYALRQCLNVMNKSPGILYSFEAVKE